MNRTIRRVSLGAAACMAVAIAFAAPVASRWQQRAQAEQIRSRCIRALSASRSWSANVVETERGSDGGRSVTRHQLLVRKPGEYRLTLIETDDAGRDVVSTMVRSRGELVTRRVDADGSSVTHIRRGVRPSLGVEYDNSLGQAVQAVSDARPLEVVAHGQRAGRAADKLKLGPSQFVWVDENSGLPVEEQVMSGGTVVRDVVFTQLQADVDAPEGAFDPRELGSSETTVVEDLGFRSATAAQAAASPLGFAPLDVSPPPGFTLDEQGYVDPTVPSGDGPAEGAFVSAFSNGLDGVIVTQVLRPGLGDSVPRAASEGPDAPQQIVVGGKPALLYRDPVRQQLVFARRDILVTIEGGLSESVLRQLAERIR